MAEPTVHALVALEETIAAVMGASWAPMANKVIAILKPLLDAQDWHAAFDAVDKITLDGVVGDNQKRLEELGVSGLLLGQSLVKPLHQTALRTGKQQFPRRSRNQLRNSPPCSSGTARPSSALATDAIAQAQLDDAQLMAQNVAEKADIFDIIDQLNAAAMGTGKAVIDIGANLTTTRLINYGFLSQAIESSVETYQVNEVLDQRICPVCKIMHGKTFSVTREKARLDQVLGTGDPQELKSLAPWPKQTPDSIHALATAHSSELQAQGLGSPPYHPGCRGTLSIVGTVPHIDIHPVALPPSILDDLKALFSPRSRNQLRNPRP